MLLSFAPAYFRGLVIALLIAVMAALFLFTSPVANAATGGCGEDLQVPCPAVTTVDSSVLDQLIAENTALKATNQYLADDNDTIHLTNEVLQQENTKLQRDYLAAYTDARTVVAVAFVVHNGLFGGITAWYFTSHRRMRKQLAALTPPTWFKK